MSFTTLVSTAGLAAHLAAPWAAPSAGPGSGTNWVILDCQHDLMNPAFGRDSYAREHIPGARFISLDDDLAEHPPATGPKPRGRHPLPTPEALAQAFSRLGIDSTKQVVVYDSAAGSYAARAWWCLRWLGHNAVAVLDGSLAKWHSEGRALTADVAPWQPAAFVARPEDTMKVETGFILAGLGANPAPRVIDARAPERYSGSTEPVDPVAGHIPGALNRFWKSNLAADGSFKDATTLRAEFVALLQGHNAAETIHQCGSGVTACHNLLALEVAGLTGARLYPGSWSEWCADPARPVATGATPQA